MRGRWMPKGAGWDWISQGCGRKELDSDLEATAGCCLSALGTEG